MGPCVLTAYVPVCLGSQEGCFQPQDHDTWLTRNLLLLVMIYLLLITTESGQGYPWIESHQFHLSCAMCLLNERERAGAAPSMQLSPNLIFVPAGGWVWPGVLWGGIGSYVNVVVMRARAGQGQAQLISRGRG